MKDKPHYQVKDGCNPRRMFDTLEEAITYLEDCLDGIDYYTPISIEKITPMSHLIALHRKKTIKKTK